MGAKEIRTGEDTVSATTRLPNTPMTATEPLVTKATGAYSGIQASLDQLVRTALESGDIQTSRTLVAAAEAELLSDNSGRIGRSDIAMAKARIAVADGDFSAAHAILVMAIERDSNHAHLRTLLSEVMLASGRATDVRPVLQHIGQSLDPTDHTHLTNDKPADSAG